jgi:hypothetical protein
MTKKDATTSLFDSSVTLRSLNTSFFNAPAETKKFQCSPKTQSHRTAIFDTYSFATDSRQIKRFQESPSFKDFEIP